MTAKATEAVLAALHGALAQAFADRIKDGAATPADLNAARQFLKDNNIFADPEENKGLQDLLKTLPTSDELDGLASLGRHPQ